MHPRGEGAVRKGAWPRRGREQGVPVVEGGEGRPLGSDSHAHLRDWAQAPSGQGMAPQALRT